ncbi:MAG: hypothetical protein H7Y27_12955 [Gemmatimonadaceae bacterium]|nr:hypothetical protein [Chitinophagaceae bacterium]
MKKSLVAIFAFVVIFSIGASAQQRNLRDLIGKWEEVGDKADNGSLEFIDSSKVVMSMKGRKLSPSSFSVDFSKTPMPLDMVMVQGDQKRVLKSLIQFVDNDTLKWQVFPAGDRGTSFTDAAATSVVLKRRK